MTYSQAPATTLTLADLQRVFDSLTPRARIEKWCVVDWVPGRWEPVTDWLKEQALYQALSALQTAKLYRVVDQGTRRAIEIIPAHEGKLLYRTDGRSWLDPPEWAWQPPPVTFEPLSLRAFYDRGIYG